MSISLVINGSTFQYPQPGDTNWGTDATGWASAVTTGMLQKAGGAFTLTAEVDFGATFGLKSVYYKTRTADIASAGQFRLAQADVISWRNVANNANLDLSVSTDLLFFDGSQIALISDLSGYQPLDAELTAISGLATDGIIVKTGAGTAATRTITGTANRVVVTDGDGVAGAPTLDIGTDVVTLTGTQSLSNKTIASPTVTGTLLLQNASGAQPELRFSEDPDNGTSYVSMKAAASMAASYDLTLPAAQGLVGTTLVNDGSGVLTWAQSSGSGEVNVVLNPSESTGWVASGAGITVGTTTTGTDLPLSPEIATAIKITPVSGTDYVYYRFTMSESLKNTMLKIQWFQRPLSGYTSGDLKVELYKNSASNYGGSYTQFALSTDSSGVSAIPNASGQYVTTFTADSADYYELRIVRVAGTTALNITSVVVGPGITAQGAVVGPQGSIPITISGGGTLTSTFYNATRVGNLLSVRGRYTVGTPSGVTIQINLPSGMTLDASAMSSASFGQILGTMNWASQNSTNNDIFATSLQGTLFYDGSTTTCLFVATQDSASNDLRKMTDTNLWAGGESVSFSFLAPIAEWAGSPNTNLGQNDVEYAFNSATAGGDNITSFAYGPQGVAAGSANASSYRRVRFLTPIQATDKLAIELSFDQVKWCEIESWTYDNVQAVQSLALQNTVYYGMGLDYSETAGAYAAPGYEVDVRFGAYASTTGGQGYGGTGLAWGTGAVYWRVIKTRAGVAIGFGLASATQAGLVKAPMSMIKVNTSNGYGSTGTAVRKFTTLASSTGSAITYTSSAVNGDSWTINQNGIYAISYTQGLTAQGVIGISLNASTTTAIDALAAANRLSSCHTPNQTPATRLGFVAWTGILSSGDVVRAQGDTTTGAGNAQEQFTICQVAVLP